MNNDMFPTPAPQAKPNGGAVMLPEMQPMVLAMCYVPPQMWTDLYDPDVGLCRGTIFPALDKPFIGEELPKAK